MQTNFDDGFVKQALKSAAWITVGTAAAFAAALVKLKVDNVAAERQLAATLDRLDAYDEGVKEGRRREREEVAQASE